MVKIPSIEADVKMKSVEEGGREAPFGSGFTTHLSVTSGELLGVRVLDALSNRKSHQVCPGDDAFIVFLLIEHPSVSYQTLRKGARFDIVENGKVIGAGTVQARVD